jgi:trimethylamine:corrinoid methyltransferase-like protein
MIEQVEESRRKALAAFEQVQIAWQTERQRMEAGGCNVAHVNARVEIPSSRLRDIDAEKARLTSPLQNKQRELEACRSEIEFLAALELQPAPPLQSLQSNDLVPIEVLLAIAFVGGSHLAPVEQ